VTEETPEQDFDQDKDVCECMTYNELDPETKEYRCSKCEVAIPCCKPDCDKPATENLLLSAPCMHYCHYCRECSGMDRLEPLDMDNPEHVQTFKNIMAPIHKAEEKAYNEVLEARSDIIKSVTCSIMDVLVEDHGDLLPEDRRAGVQESIQNTVGRHVPEPDKPEHMKEDHDEDPRSSD